MKHQCDLEMLSDDVPCRGAEASLTGQEAVELDEQLQVDVV